jgi:hypothetical protein
VRAAILVVASVKLLAAPSATAKERMDVEVCGVASCTTVAHLDARVTDRYAWTRAPSGVPFFTIQSTTQPVPALPALRRTIVYVPSKGIWRVRLAGVDVWLDVPLANEPILRKAVRRLRPCPPSATWTCTA